MDEPFDELMGPPRPANNPTGSTGTPRARPDPLKPFDELSPTSDAAAGARTVTPSNLAVPIPSSFEDLTDDDADDVVVKPSAVLSSVRATKKSRPWRDDRAAAEAATRGAYGSSSTSVRSSGSSAAGPPASAFQHSHRSSASSGAGNSAEKEVVPLVHTTSTDRWAQYDTPELSEQAAKASAEAIALAAERAALHQVQTEESSALKLDLAKEGDDDEMDPGPIVNVVSMDEDEVDDSSPSPTRRQTGRLGSYYNSPERLDVDDRLAEAGASLPPPPPSTSSRGRGRERESVANKLGRSLSKGLTNLLGSNADREEQEEEELVVLSEGDRVRMEAMKMLELADDAHNHGGAAPYSLRKTRSGGYSSSYDGGSARSSLASSLASSQGGSRRDVGRERSSLMGLDFGSSMGSEMEGERGGRENDETDDRFSIDDDDDDDDAVDDEEEEEGVDLVSMKAGPFNRHKRTDSDYDDVIIEEDLSPPKKKKTESSWSDRYSVNHHLMAITGGKVSSTEMLSKMDREHSSPPEKSGGRMSARNMFSANPYNIQEAFSSSSGSGGLLSGWDSSHSKQKDRSSQKKCRSPFGNNKKKEGTIWMDVDLRSGNSLPPPPVRTRTYVEAEKRRVRRERICVVIAAIAIISAVVGIVLATTGGGGGGDDAEEMGSALVGYENVGEQITFYVTADVPFDYEGSEKLARNLDALPADAEFVVHLGDVTVAADSDCKESVYEDAKAVLEQSPKPVFVLPGSNDWNECPDPAEAFDYWNDNLNHFEERFEPHPFQVDRDFDRDENFAFLHNGVLFIGINLVGGTVRNRGEWQIRHEQNVRWTEQNMFDEYREEEFRAVIIFGHAKPTFQHSDYFDPIIDDAVKLGKPVLYMHSNGGDGSDMDQYQLSPKAPTFWAVQVQEGGIAPPLRVTVGFGGTRPYLFDEMKQNGSRLLNALVGIFRA